MKIIKFIIVSLLFTTIIHAQVGIGTLQPDDSAMLEVNSESQGLLAPRMDTAHRLAIDTPAESLLVFDTTEKAFFFYNTDTSTWIKLANEAGTKRTNYKLVKNVSDLAPELAAGGNNSYKLNTNTYYEINGLIELAKPIDLNNAYIAGMDSGEDILKANNGTVFKGNTGGGIRNLTLKGNQAFDITGPGLTSASSLLVQNVIVDEMTVSVGKISGLGLYFSNIAQFIKNTDGITYSNIGNLLLNNQGWLGNNTGTFEKFTGSFGLIEKVSGFSTVNGGAVGVDVSLNPTVGTGILQGTVFSGTANKFIKGYVFLPARDYDFTTNWTVDSPGIRKESDSEATGDINLSTAVGSGATTSFSGTGSSSRKRVNGTTSSNNLFRFIRDGDNKVIYTGNKPRYFQVAGSVSYQGNSDMILILYIAKNGTVLEETKVYGKAASGYFVNGGILALPIIGTVKLEKNDSIEIWAERYTGDGSMLTVSLNLIVR